MLIRCSKCNREMNFTELATYPLLSLVLLFGPILAKQIYDKLQEPKRDFNDTRGFEDVMSTYANKFLVLCPKCHKTGYWAPVDEKKEEKKAKDAQLQKEKAALAKKIAAKKKSTKKKHLQQKTTDKK